MLNIFKAIKSTWNVTGLSLYFYEAPQGIAQPYCCYSMVSGWPDWTFEEDFENIRIQFSVFDENLSGINTINYNTAIKTLMDNKVLTVTGFTKHLKCWRTMEQIFKEEGEYWHGILEYELMFQK